MAEKIRLQKVNSDNTKLINELRQSAATPTSMGHLAKRPRQDDDELHGFVKNETLLETMKNMINPIALSIKKMEEKQETLENNQATTSNSSELIKLIQQQMAPFTEILNQLSANQEKIQQTIQNIKINVAPRPPAVQLQGDNQQQFQPKVNYDNSSRQRPTVAPLPLSYAQAVSKSPIPADAIRNVTVNGTTEQMEIIVNKIKRDKIAVDAQLKSIKAKGKYNFTYKCTDAATADKFEEELRQKYKDEITVSKVKPTKNQVKITKILTDSSDASEVFDQIVTQNSWMRDLGLAPDRLYSINTPKGTYMNLILNCDIQAHTELLKRSTIIFGFAECRIYEYVNTLQCLNCQRYGHFARECTFSICCKYCSLGHDAKSCILQTNKYTCHNCVLANKRNSTKYNVRHATTDDRCPSRIERLEALKHIILAKN